MSIRRLASLLGILLIFAGTAAAQTPTGTPAGTQVATGTPPTRNKMILGCWASATTGDRASLKLAFRNDGAMVQYDERQPDQLRRTAEIAERVLVQSEECLELLIPDRFLVAVP